MLHGEAQWLRLLLQLNDPRFLVDDKRACLPLGDLPDDASCPVEYTYALDPAGHVQGVQARVLSGADSLCAAYVQCRLPGLAGATLSVPRDEHAGSTAGLRVLDKIRHATRRPTVADEAREITEITALLAEPASTEPAPAEVQRLNEFLRQRRAQLLEVLTHRRQRR